MTQWADTGPAADRIHPVSPPAGGEIRVDLAGFARDGELGNPRDCLAIAQEADRLGYGAIWFNEFHFDRHRLPFPSILLLGAAILACTERLRFGTSVLVLPLHHPLLLAEQVAQLDWQGGGRLDVGIGRGTDPSSFRALGIDPAEARPRFSEALQILRKVWCEDPVSHAGTFWSFENLSVGPPPVQRPHPPLYMAAVSPDSIDLAARLNLPLLYSLEPNEDRQVGPFRDALARHGQGLSALQAASLSRYVVIAARRDDAMAQLDRLTARLNAARAVRARARGDTAPAPRTRAQMLAGHAIAGTPAECIDQIRTLCARHGSRSIRVLFSANGLVPIPQALDAMRFFAAQVLPALSCSSDTQGSP